MADLDDLFHTDHDGRGCPYECGDSSHIHASPRAETRRSRTILAADIGAYIVLGGLLFLFLLGVGFIASLVL